MAEKFESLPGSWSALFDAVDEHIHGPKRRAAIVRLYEAVRYLVDACPDDNAIQLAARRGGRLVSDDGEGRYAVQMLRVASLIELMQEAQKEKCSVTAYKRAQKALRMLGLDDPQAVNQAFYFLGYHTREGKPHEWLIHKLPEKQREAYLSKSNGSAE